MSAFTVVGVKLLCARRALLYSLLLPLKAPGKTHKEGLVSVSTVAVS